MNSRFLQEKKPIIWINLEGVDKDFRNTENTFTNLARMRENISSARALLSTHNLTKEQSYKTTQVLNGYNALWRQYQPIEGEIVKRIVVYK